jgi:hypothetical protein
MTCRIHGQLLKLDPGRDDAGSTFEGFGPDAMGQ